MAVIALSATARIVLSVARLEFERASGVYMQNL